MLFKLKTVRWFFSTFAIKNLYYQDLKFMLLILYNYIFDYKI